MDLQISYFRNFFIKNGSHGTIYTFKNDFTTVFFSFSFKFSAVSKRTVNVNVLWLNFSNFIYMYVYIYRKI